MLLWVLLSLQLEGLAELLLLLLAEEDALHTSPELLALWLAEAVAVWEALKEADQLPVWEEEEEPVGLLELLAVAVPLVLRLLLAVWEAEVVADELSLHTSWLEEEEAEAELEKELVTLHWARKSESGKRKRRLDEFMANATHTAGVRALPTSTLLC